MSVIPEKVRHGRERRSPTGAIAEQLAEVARTLAHSTRAVPNPSDSYALLANLTAAQRSLTQVYEQLAAWHSQARDGGHYTGEDTPAVPPVDGPLGAIGARARLYEAKEHAERAERALTAAHSANSVVRWYAEEKPQKGA